MRKIAIGFLGLLLPLSALATGLNVTINGQVVIFTDVPEDAWFASYVREAIDAEIASGYKNNEGNPTGQFGPSNPVTEAEAFKMVMLSSGYDYSRYPSLPLASPCTHWVCPYVRISMQESFYSTVSVNSVTGEIDQRSFDKPITREDMVRLVGDAFGISHTTLTLESDVPYTNPYVDLENNFKLNPTTYSILRLTNDHILSGDTDINGKVTGKFRPTNTLNRAEAVKIILGAQKAYGKVGASHPSNQ